MVEKNHNDDQNKVTESQNDRSGATRRRLLRTVAAGGIASVGLGAVTDTVVATPEQPGVTVAEYRNRDAGLSRDEIRRLQTRALEQYRSQTDDRELKIVGSPDVWADQVETDLSVVSYALKVYPDGTSEYDAQVVEDGQPEHVVSEAHAATRAFVDEVSDRRRPTSADTGFSTQSTNASYDYVAGGSTSNAGCPEGTISMTSDVYEWVTDDSDRVLFATQTDFQAIPGTNRDACNGVWYNGYTDEASHQWNESDLSGGEQVDHKPAGGKSGSTSSQFTISTSGASISWAYDQPNVERDDNSTLDEAEWYYDYNSSEAASQTCVWETGSEAEFDKYQNPDYGDTLHRGYFKHRFFDKLNYGREMKDVSDYYHYGYG